MLEKITHINLLYDFYHYLLTDKQRKYMEYYYQDDLSLSEIAEQFQVSRQAVFEHIKRAEKLLLDYESQLQLLAKHNKRQELISQMDTILQQEVSQIAVDELQAIVTALKHVD